MRKLFLLFLAAVMFCVPCFAEDISGEGNAAMCGDGLSWYVDGSVLYVTGQGEMYDFPGGAPWAAYKDTLTQVNLDDGVTCVGAYAFRDYDRLTDVRFGNSLTRIGAEAFYSCDGLTSISLPATFKKFGESSFRSCSNLKQIHCSGGFPRFDENCLWDTWCTIYYSASNPWSVVYIEQLETAFQGRIEFRSSDGTDPYVPTEATESTQPTYVTEPVTTPIIFTVPTEETTVQTVPTTAPTTAPTTIPAAVPETTSPETTKETFLMAQQPTTAPEVTESYRATDGNSIFGVLILVLTLAIIATSALLFRAGTRKPRRRKKKRKF